ncbi:MAG: GNAT family N-acetyltransferase [Gammaproteobacteria bacterium]
MPVDIRIRPAGIDDCDAVGLVTVTASHSVFIGVVPEEQLDLTWTPAVSAANWRQSFAGCKDRGQIFDLALEDERVVGYVWARPWADTPGYDSAVPGLYVLPTRQHLGIGRRLLSHAASAMGRTGAQSLEIGCIRENPSCGFYRHLGGREIGQRPASVDGWDTVEILFGWPDIATLT